MTTKRYTSDSIRGMVVTDDKISSRRWVRAEDYEKLEREAADALESAGELPEPKCYLPDPQRLTGMIESDGIRGAWVTRNDYDTLRTAYSALAARLRDMQDTDDITMTAFKKLEDMNSELVAQRDAAIHGAGKLMQRQQAESRIAELERCLIFACSHEFSYVEFSKHVYQHGGTGDIGDCITFIDAQLSTDKGEG